MTINFTDPGLEKAIKEEAARRGDNAHTTTAKNLIRERLTILEQNRDRQIEPPMPPRPDRPALPARA